MDKKNNRQSPSAVQKLGNGNDSKRPQNNGKQAAFESRKGKIYLIDWYYQKP
jgi:hypothetical protein